MRFDGALFASNFEFIQWSIVNEIAKRIAENSKSVFCHGRLFMPTDNGPNHPGFCHRDASDSRLATTVRVLMDRYNTCSLNSITL